MAQDPYVDAVLVRGGHSRSAYAAAAGVGVPVLKGGSVPGAAAATEKPWPAFQTSAVSDVVSVVPAQIDEAVPLAASGYQVSIVDRLDTESLGGAARPVLGRRTTTPPFEKGSP